MKLPSVLSYTVHSSSSVPSAAIPCQTKKTREIINSHADVYNTISLELNELNNIFNISISKAEIATITQIFLEYMLSKNRAPRFRLILSYFISQKNGPLRYTGSCPFSLCMDGKIRQAQPRAFQSPLQYASGFPLFQAYERFQWHRQL